MEFIGTLFGQIIKDGHFTVESLIMVLIGLVILLYYKVFKPMETKIEAVPTLLQLQELNDKIRAQDVQYIDKLTNKVEKLINDIDEIGDLEGNTYREVLNVKNDIEQIKQILNQFQGHMMYGGQNRNNNDFGNRELK